MDEFQPQETILNESIQEDNQKTLISEENDNKQIKIIESDDEQEVKSQNQL